MARRSRNPRRKRANRDAPGVHSSPPLLTGKYRFLMWSWEFFGVGLGIVFLVIAGAMLTLGIVVLNLATDSESWPTTPGVVTASWVEREMGSRSYSYEPHVTYSYAVEGAAYVGNDVRAGDFSISDRSDAEAIVAKYPVGSDVDVRYDPGDPGRAVLETGVSGASLFWMLLWMVIGVGCAVGGVVVLAPIIRDAWQRIRYAAGARRSRH
jgi:hypothetical protein